MFFSKKTKWIKWLFLHQSINDSHDSRVRAILVVISHWIVESIDVVQAEMDKGIAIEVKN